MTEMWRLDATAQAKAIRRGEVTPDALLDLALQRVARLNPQVNAVIATFEDLARQQIAVLDPSAPFAGVPILLKDAAQELAGTPYALGTPVLKEAGYVSTETTEVTERLLRAGFVIFGKTNVPELSSGYSTEPTAFGATRNPWHLERIAGGSSGGAAAAVAAGMVALAHGCDATGSLRVPASACGLVTLRASRGVLPPLAPADQPSDVWTDGVLARSVRDVAGVLDAIGDTAHLDPAAARPLRVGVLRHDAFMPLPLDPACTAAVDATADVLRALGHEVREGYPPSYDGLFQRVGVDLTTTVARSRVPQVAWIEERVGRTLGEGDLSPQVLAAARSGLDVTEEAYAEANARIQAEMDAALPWWDDFDVLLSPVTRQRPWLLGTGDGPRAGSLFVWPCSFTGQPSMSVPVHWSEDGLPVGVQLVGAPNTDRTLLALAEALETALPWASRWPALAEA